MIETGQELAKTQPEETRDRIIAAGRDVIARKGKRGATTREIADLAGVNEATLFRHFGNKESLMIAVAKASCPDTRLRDITEHLTGPIEQQLITLATAMNQTLESMIDIIRWSMVEVEYENSLFAQEAWRPQTAVHGVIADYMRTQVENSVLQGNPEDLTMVFMGMIFSRVISRGKFPESRLMNDSAYAIPTIVNIFLNGVRSK
jgi:AcrR family transcriptional regulator